MASGALRVDITGLTGPTGGLVDVLNAQGRLHDSADPHVGAGITFETEFCGTPDLAPGLCDSALVPPDTEKEFVTPGADESDPFGIYWGAKCLPGFYDYESLASGELERMRSVGYEKAMQKQILDPATLVTGGPFTIPIALAIAEEMLGVATGGVGEISVGLFGASLLSGYRGVVDDDGFLRTRLGTPIIAGAGFAERNSGTPGGFKMWVHAPVDLWVGPIFTNQGYDLVINEEVAVAEQVGSFSKPCFIAAIAVQP